MFAEDVALFLLDDEGVVFQESTQELHALSTSAAYVWCCRAERLTVRETVDAFSRTFDTTESYADESVRRIITEWKAQGLMSGRAGSKIRVPADAASEPATGDRPIDTRPLRGTIETQRFYHLLGHNLRIRFTNRDQEARLAPTIAHLEATGAGDDEAIIDIDTDGRNHSVLLNSSPRFEDISLDELVPAVMLCLFPTGVRLAAPFMTVHAAAVSDDERCVLLPGVSGSGKTSLTAALLGRGFRYLSDDVVLMDVGAFCVRGVPYSLCVKEGGTPAVDRIFPGVAALPTHRRPDGKIVRYFSPPSSRLWPAADRGPAARWIVFPRYEPESTSALTCLTASAALRRLMPLCSFGGRLQRQQVSDLIAWLKGVDSYELMAASATEGSRLVAELLG